VLWSSSDAGADYSDRYRLAIEAVEIFERQSPLLRIDRTGPGNPQIEPDMDDPRRVGRDGNDVRGFDDFMIAAATETRALIDFRYLGSAG
jgi:hypothetical protein